MRNIFMLVMVWMVSVAAMAVTYPTYRPSTPQFGGGRSAEPDRVINVQTSTRTDNSLELGHQFHSPYNTLSYPTFSGDLAVPMGGNASGYDDNGNSGTSSNGGNARRGNARRAVGGNWYYIGGGIVVDEQGNSVEGEWRSDGYFYVNGNKTDIYDAQFMTQGDTGATPIGENLWVLLMMALALACCRWAYNYNWKREVK